MAKRLRFGRERGVTGLGAARRCACALPALLCLAATGACSVADDEATRGGLGAGRELDAAGALDAGEQDALGDAASLANDAAAPSDAFALSDAAPRLSELVQSLFMPSCLLGRCHVTAAPAGGLSFTGRRISVHAALVNAPSSELPQRMRVAPYDPDASYLMEKLESSMPTVGEPMPPLGSVPKEQIARVRAWIAAGAKDD